MEMMELNLNEMDMISGGWDWKKYLIPAAIGGVIGATAGGSVGGGPGMVVGGVIGAAAGVVVALVDD